VEAVEETAEQLAKMKRVMARFLNMALVEKK
jgi:hypothetical protein